MGYLIRGGEWYQLLERAKLMQKVSLWPEDFFHAEDALKGWSCLEKHGFPFILRVFWGFILSISSFSQAFYPVFPGHFHLPPNPRPGDRRRCGGLHAARSGVPTKVWEGFFKSLRPVTASSTEEFHMFKKALRQVTAISTTVRQKRTASAVQGACKKHPPISVVCSMIKVQESAVSACWKTFV